jgi:RNA polymerase sigma factor (sigma-70 family)
MTSATRGVVFQQIDRLYRDGTLSGMGDGQLLERYLTHRDQAAFEALVNLHGPMVLGLCRRVLRDPRDIEDAFQATFLILVRKAPTIRDPGHLANWLYGVAYRVARRARTNLLRRRDREIAVVNLEAPAGPDSPDTPGIGPALDEELSRLPRKYRAPLVLCYLNGRTHDQAAQELGCPVGTVRSRLARGRDLLRRRLTSRGHGPTAAILGPTTAMPAKLMTEAVPPPLVAATVDAAVAIGASQTIQAGALSASVLTLTHGVLTTMKLAQLKFVGMAILATSLSAGGVIAVSYAAGQNPTGAPVANGALATAAGPQEKAVAGPLKGVVVKGVVVKDGAVVEERLKSLETKVDELLTRSKSAATAATAATTSRPSSRNRAFFEQDDARTTADPQNRSIPELEAALKLAIDNDRLTERLFRNAGISAVEREHARGEVLLLKAKLQGRDEELADEIDRLNLEIKTMRAGKEKANAQSEVASSVVARNVRLTQRKPGMVSVEDVAKAEWELKLAVAQVAMVDAEIAEVELRVRQLERRRTRIQQIIKMAG